MTSEQLGDKTTEIVKDFFRLQFDLKKFEGIAYPADTQSGQQSGTEYCYQKGPGFVSVT